MKKKHVLTGVLSLGYIGIISGTILFFLNWAYNPYLLILGVILFVVARYLSLERSNDYRLKRLNNLQAFGMLLLIASGYLVWIGSSSFVVTLLAFAILELWVSLRYPSKQKEE